MTESSRLRDRWSWGEHPPVAQECPQHTRPSAGKGDDGLDVLETFGALLEVEVPVRAFADDAGLRGQAEARAGLSMRITGGRS